MTAQEAIDEIHSVAARRKALYRTLDVLETELKDGGGLPAAFRGFSDRPQEVARRTRHAELAQEIQALRARLDELRQSVPFERIAEIDHYWNIEHTTSHSLLRDMGNNPP
jgi:predicted LPLAT superfamily acyltransferase